MNVDFNGVYIYIYMKISDAKASKSHLCLNEIIVLSECSPHIVYVNVSVLR